MKNAPNNIDPDIFPFKTHRHKFYCKQYIHMYLFELGDDCIVDLFFPLRNVCNFLNSLASLIFSQLSKIGKRVYLRENYLFDFLNILWFISTFYEYCLKRFIIIPIEINKQKNASRTLREMFGNFSCLIFMTYSIKKIKLAADSSFILFWLSQLWVLWGVLCETVFIFV